VHLEYTRVYEGDNNIFSIIVESEKKNCRKIISSFLTAYFFNFNKKKSFDGDFNIITGVILFIDFDRNDKRY